MPYKKVTNHPKCPAEKPLGLVKEDDDKLMGCHVDEESANKQIAALHASEDGREEELHEVAGRQKETIMGDLTYTRAVLQTDEVRAEDLLKDPSLPVPFIASTEGVKSDGKNLRMADWDLARYGQYGPILWVHDYTHPPLGTGAARAEDVLKIDVAFDEDDPFAQIVRRKSLKGMMSGSVGWRTTKDGKNELIEFTMAPVPIDLDALPAVQRMGLRAMQVEIAGALEEDPDESLKFLINALRKEALDEIKELLAEYNAHDAQESTESEEEEEERGEETEEPVTEEEIESEIEPEAEPVEEEEDLDVLVIRAGAMLSKKNREDLRKALDLIKSVIARATPDETVPVFNPARTEEEEQEQEEDEPVNQRGQDEGSDKEPPELYPEVLAQILEVLDTVKE